MFSNKYLRDLSKTEGINLYFNSINRYLNIEAIFSDESYVNPIEPTSEDEVTIKFRTFKNNVDRVYINYSGLKLQLNKTNTKDIFDYYFIVIPKIEKKITYYFTVVKNNREYYYNKRGLFDTVEENYNFIIVVNFKTPDWAKGALMYQIYVDRFYNGDKSNDVLEDEYVYLGYKAKKLEWETPVEPIDICNFYGGDLQGVIEKMDYLSSLGVEAIYFNPLFVSPSSHKYDIQDYDYIDPHYGVIIEDGGSTLAEGSVDNTNASMYIQRTTNIKNLEASNKLIIKLIEIAHSKGIKVILDGVFNHCGAFNKWLDREKLYELSNPSVGAYRTKESKYIKYFKWKNNGWPDNDSYDNWWGHSNHPKLNFEESEELYNYILEMGKKWISPPFNADGWRLDVAEDLGYSKEFNHKFWIDFRNVIKNENEDAIIIAEHYGDPTDWLQGDQWDTIMNYDAFMEPITWFLTGVSKHSEEYKKDMVCNAVAFENSMRYYMSKLPIQSQITSMNELSNHDHSRFLTRTNQKIGRLHTVGREKAGDNINKNIFMEGIVFQMTWIGAPTIYYGDEAGLLGWTDPDNRRTYPWGKEDSLLLELHKNIIKIRKMEPVLKFGALEYLHLEYGVISYGRFNDEDKIIIILNNNDHTKELKIPVWKVEVSLNGKLQSLIITGNNNFTTEKQIYSVKDGFLSINMQAYSSAVLKEFK